MEKVKVRINNSHKHIWAVVWNGQPEDFSDAKDITLIASVRDKRINLTQGIDYVIEGNLVKIDFTPRFCKNTGVYNIELNYTKPSESFLSGERRTAVDLNVIEIVGTSACADATDETSSVSEAAFGFQGLSAYEVWLKDNPGSTKEDYFNWLQKPATDAVSLIDAKIDELDTAIQQESERVEAEDIRLSNEQSRVDAEGLRVSGEVARNTAEGIRVGNESTRIYNEGIRLLAEEDRIDAEDTRVENETLRISAELLRVNAESLRVTAETSRQTAESLRVEAEELRQSKTQEAISNAENATENANTAATNADNARLAIQDDLALKEATANKQNSLAPDGTGTKFPTVDAVNAGINNLLASYKLTSNTEIYMTALDPVTGIFTANNHGLTQDKVIAWNLNTGVNLLPYQVIPVEITGGQYGNYYVDIVDANNFRIKKTPTDQTLTFASAGDITKWHFETNLASFITISNLAPYKKIRVVTKIISNNNVFFLLHPTNSSIAGNNWYISGGISNLYQATLNLWGYNMPAYAESEFYFDEISTVRHRIYGFRHLSASPTTVTSENLDLVWVNMGNLGALTINDMRLSSHSRYLLNGTTIEIYKI